MNSILVPYKKHLFLGNQMCLFFYKVYVIQYYGTTLLEMIYTFSFMSKQYPLCFKGEEIVGAPGWLYWLSV